ncbi:dihydrofolate reductase family protein [Kribbella sp. NPDC058693]|uniref:dihydrofolate reductase family protein n=1 Tax=Kribbella sp. NPDC058693 TaxID=3346602 RepID=UPI00364A8528
MRKLVVIEYLSLDGVVQGPGHAAEDEDGGFDLGGWTGPHMADHREWGSPLYQAAGAFVFGRRTYDLWLPHWSTITDPDDLIAAALNGRPKYVASTTLTAATWPGTTVWPDRIPERVAELKAQPGGDILIAGSAALASDLIDRKLVDTYHLWFHPVVLGAGKRLFPPGLAPQQDLDLISSTTTRTGLAILTYERALNS